VALMPEQLTIDGGAVPLVASPEPEQARTHEQPRLFEPQYEGQLTMDNPESGATAPDER
jgi:hypothetical protein